jgi:hypothetical protein
MEPFSLYLQNCMNSSSTLTILHCHIYTVTQPIMYKCNFRITSHLPGPTDYVFMVYLMML